MAKNSLLDIQDILSDYVDEIQDSVTQIADEVAEQGKNLLKNTTNTYHVRSGKYNKGWRVKKGQGRNYVHNTIYNATGYQLTHLLENGHVGKNQYGQWGIVDSFPHINKVDQLVTSTYSREVENAIKKGGK